MKITSLEIDGYGVWTGLRAERLSEALNVFHGPNEAGKTTLLEFIRSMLYGFAPPRQRYFPPVRGGRPGGRLEIASPHGHFRIERHFVETDGRLGEQLAVVAADGSRQGEHFLKVLLSDIDEPVFNNVFAVGLREIQELSTLGDTAAAEMLYSLSLGLDRVSLVDVARELAASRNRLIDAGGGPSQATLLMIQREKLLGEIAELSALNRHYELAAVQRRRTHAEIVQLEEEVNRAQRQLRLVELAAALGERWTRRAELDAQLEAIGSTPALGADALGRFDALKAHLRRHRGRLELLARRREELRRELQSLPINEPLWRQAARIEALAEQEPWIAQLQTQVWQQEGEIARLDSDLAAEAQRLGLGDVSAAAPNWDAKRLTALRRPGKTLAQNRGLFVEAKQAAAAAAAEADSLARQFNSALAGRGGGNLAAALDQAGRLVSQLRRRKQIDQRLEQLAEHQNELDDRSQSLGDNQFLPLGALVALGAVFVCGVVLLLTALFLPVSIVGTLGWPLAVLGLVGAGAAVGGKVFFERASAGRLEGCRKQLELVGSQIEQARGERDAIDAQLGGPAHGTLAAAEQELALLEELSPLDARRQTARRQADEALARQADARKAFRAARRQWQEALAANGLPREMSARQLRQLIAAGGRIAAARAELQQRREELSRRRKELESIAARIEQLAAEVGVPRPSGAEIDANKLHGLRVDGPHPRPLPKLENIHVRPGSEQSLEYKFSTGQIDPLTTLRGLAEAAARQQERHARRQQIRLESRRLRSRQAKHEDVIERLRRRRRGLLIEAGARDEREFRRRALETARVHTLRAERDSLEGEIQAALAGHCSQETIARQLEPPDPAALESRRAHLHEQAEQLRGRLHALLEQRGRLDQQLAEMKSDRRRDEKRLQLAEVEKRLEDVVLRWQTLSAASSILDRIRDTYERHRQPETLQEASGYLQRLTEGRYVRVWTPLGEHVLKVDDAQGHSLPVESLSRGTREQLFLGLRLALAACYARRGAPMALVLDDVLVNFDSARARAAAAVLDDFAAAGHQMLVFTCHEHIMEMFAARGAPVARLPDNAEPGRTIELLESPAAEERPRRRRRAAAPRRAAETPREDDLPPVDYSGFDEDECEAA